MLHRTEIDGLRAFAVLPVIVFHAEFPLLPGGFLGVDIFFVISGYLITAILMEDIDKGRFSLAKFYERRARRILPALAVMLAVTVPFAYAWMIPPQLEEYGHSLIAVPLFLSNVLFFFKTDYFTPAAEEQPLLHTWSLAVEEQFYIFFPILLLLLWRHARPQLTKTVIVLLFAGFFISEIGWRTLPEADFYLLPFRGWELLAGSACALVQRKYGQGRHEWLAALGLALVVASFVLLGPHTPMQSLLGILPVTGTALIILFASEKTWAARILSLKPFVAIGLISYSAYLWHQPIFAFARIRMLGAPDGSTMVMLTLLTLFVAWLSWQFIEQPFRRKRMPLFANRADVFTATAAASIFVVAVGVVATHVAYNPRWMNLTPMQQAYLASTERSPMHEACYLTRHEDAAATESCTFFEDDVRVAVLGDSHSTELAFALAEELRPFGTGVRQFSRSACGPPFSNEGGMSMSCVNWVKDVVDLIIADEEITHVVLGYRLNLYLSGSHEEVWPALPSEHDEAHRNSIIRSLHELILTLSHTKEVVMLAQVPELPAPIEELVYRDYLDRNGEILGVTRAWWDDRTRFDRTHRTDLPDNFTLIDPTEIFCSSDRCFAGRNGVSYYFDDDHLSIHGARQVARAILPHVMN
ncbi:acyltransferase family protein [Pontivivens ytuae]|uniref:Acyltransferase n=1 Tax=Pontivivens ytuae TaxID=2789856 RepID=A0A7S9LQR4_9RHOB|nr:acyltransferase family protein [Pontivivens ytuae]QPH53566.1 acyltransferase [Pontivivens ytuae]